MLAILPTVEAKPQKQVNTDTNTQTGVVPWNQKTFFSPQYSNATSVALPAQSFPGWQLNQTDMSHELAIHHVAGDIRACQQKMNGVSAGKICVIKGKKYLLKVSEEGVEKRDRYSNILLGMHNLYFVRENIGITIPNIKLIYEKNGQYISSGGEVVDAENYLASEFIENFTGFKSIVTQSTRTLMKLNHRKGVTTGELEIEEAIRQKVVGQVGEQGLAKLAVAGTFIQDLVMNEGNWGIANGKLVIIDADHSPQSLEEYLVEATKMPGNINLASSIQTLEHMAVTYQKMLHKRPIYFHPEVDFTVDDYEFLVNQYLTACTQAIDKIKTTHPQLPTDKPSKTINDALSTALRVQLSEYMQLQPSSFSL
ncbi:hypothetical protein [Legionella tunisiensis]|uniref:hypothetical protein n=1 Tax=Legionella tunisiensis TaxID=1034944 RepID=UPI0002D669E4|nr:hypothetical protein [Legionella tunisiensis]